LFVFVALKIFLKKRLHQNTRITNLSKRTAAVCADC